MTKLYSKNVFENISHNFEFFKKHRKRVQDNLMVSPCSNFQLDISENGWVIRFFIFQYTGYIILQKFKSMFWHVLKVAQEHKWCHWISELKLHLVDTFLLLLVTFKTWLFFYLTFSLALLVAGGLLGPPLISRDLTGWFSKFKRH